MQNLIEDILLQARATADARQQLVDSEQRLISLLEHAQQGDLFNLQNTVNEVQRAIRAQQRRRAR